MVVGDGPYALCYNAAENKVYSANRSGGKVTVIDAATNNLITVLVVGSSPYALCYNPTNNKVYCANRDSANVTVIDGATDVVLRTMTVGDGPTDFAWNPVQNRVYVCNSAGGSITVLRDSGGAAVGEVSKPQVAGRRLEPTIVRGTLFLPEVTGPKSRATSLLDISGRSVQVLKPGANDVRALAPGVYFIREGLGTRGEGLGKTQKVVVTR
jgi:YVTN family beta-propeller protein